MTDVADRIITIIANSLSISKDEVVPTASFVDDLGADSLDMANMFQALEKEFRKRGHTIKIEEGDVEDIETVQQLIDLLASKGIKS